MTRLTLTPSAPGLAGLVESMKREADVLRANGADDLARVKLRDAESIADAEPDAVRWLSESEAMLRTGWPLARVRRHAAQYQHSGHAVREKNAWRMLAVIVPQRIPSSVLEQRARMEAAS